MVLSCIKCRDLIRCALLSEKGLVASRLDRHSAGCPRRILQWERLRQGPDRGGALKKSRCMLIACSGGVGKPVGMRKASGLALSVSALICMQCHGDMFEATWRLGRWHIEAPRANFVSQSMFTSTPPTPVLVAFALASALLAAVLPWIRGCTHVAPRCPCGQPAVAPRLQLVLPASSLRSLSVACVLPGASASVSVLPCLPPPWKRCCTRAAPRPRGLLAVGTCGFALLRPLACCCSPWFPPLLPRCGNASRSPNALKHNQFPPHEGHWVNSREFLGRIHRCPEYDSKHSVNNVPLSAIAFCSGSRIGEAGNPGPYYEGGSSSSAVASPGGNADPGGLHHPPPLTLPNHKGQLWEWTSQEQELAAGIVPRELWWPIPVLCRCVNHLLQSEIRLMHPDDILDFVKHELYGENWTEEGLESALSKLYSKGGGTFDPADIIQGPSDIKTLDGFYGFADAVPAVSKPYANFYPMVSKVASIKGPIGQFLHWAEKHDASAASAEIMLRCANHGIMDVPTIEEEIDHMEVSMDPEPLHVSAYVPRYCSQKKKKKRPRQQSAFPAAEYMESIARSGRSRRPTATRGSGSNRSTVDIILLNSSGRPQLLAALEESLGASIVMNQEHHCQRPALVDLQYAAKDLGWVLVGAAAARTTKEASSAGVAIAAKTDIRVGSINGKFDHSPATLPGRIAAAWIQIGPPSGIVLISIYLFHSEGMTVRNRSLFQRAMAVARAYGSPWIIAGDFNESPEVMLQQWGSTLEETDSYVISPNQSTHRPRGAAHRTIDFLICSSSAEPWVKDVSVDEGFHAHPHRAVRIKLSAVKKNYLITAIKKPKPFANRAPTGCARQPVLPAWNKVVPGCPSWSGGGHALDSQSAEPVDALWPDLCHAMETELCRLHGCVSPQGMAKNSHSGRSQGLRTVQRLALPMRASAELGKVSMPAHALAWLSTRVKELANVSRKVERGHLISSKAYAQWTDIMNKVTAQRGLPEFIRKLGIEWEEKLDFVKNHTPGRDTFSLERISELAKVLAHKIKADHFETRASSWKNFVDKQLKNGAASAHRLVKREAAPVFDTATTGSADARTASPQKILDRDLEEWKTIWKRLGDTPAAPWRHHQPDLPGGVGGHAAPHELPPITAEDILKAARTFKAETSIGCDNFSPRSIADLSPQLRSCIADFLNVAEQEGRWPEQIATAIVHLIPKADGGRRPIGVLPTIVRIWERVRKPIVQVWLRQNARQYDWASQGRSSEAAAWHQSVLDEAATADGLTSGTTFMDLAKAFESVSLEHVWRAGVKHAFPRRVLVLLLEAFAFARRLSYQGSVSEAVNTLSAILAGGGFAQVALFLVLIDPLDDIQIQYPIGVTVCLYVDDIAVNVTGHPEVVAAVLAQCTSDLIATLEDDLQMTVSRRSQWANSGKAKTVAAVSSAKLGRALSTSMRRMGILVARKAKHLGVMHGPGARTRATGQQVRWIKNAARRARVARLGRRLGRHIFRTGLKPAALYGSSVTALNLGTVRSMRKEAGQAFGGIQGRSLTARLAVNQCDPGWDAAKNPIMAWVNEVWTAQVPARIMQRAWMQGITTSTSTNRPHSSAGGAASTYLAAIFAVGWKAPSFDSVVTLDGTVLPLSQVDPKTVLRYLNDDYQIVTASSSKIHEAALQSAPSQGVGGNAAPCKARSYTVHRGKPAPWYEPAASVINGKWARDIAPSAIASAATLPEGGWWTQKKLFEAGLADDSTCKLCNDEEGTLQHRLFHCKRRKQLIEAQCPAWLERCAHEEESNPLFTCGLPLRPQVPAPPPPAENWIGSPPSGGAAARGCAFTDGALKGTVPKARRAGWAYIVLDDLAEPWGKFGICSEAYTTVLRAELRALAEILRVTVGPITVYVDNSQVVDGIQRGRKWCLHPKRDGADVWKEVWDRLDDLEGLVRVEKVKAHLNYGHVVEGRISWTSWLGNGIADQWAKLGCQEAERLSPAAWVQREWSKASELYRWAVRVAAEWLPDTLAKEPQCPEQRPTATPAKAKPPRRDTTSSHELWSNHTRTWCRLCGVTAAATKGKTPPAFSRPCRGTMGTRCGTPGREVAKSPLPHSFDDGIVGLQYLWAQGALREQATLALPPGFSEEEAYPSDPGAHHHTAVHPSEADIADPALLLGGHAKGEDEVADMEFQYAEEDVDPFNFANLGFDNIELQVQSGNASLSNADSPTVPQPAQAHASHRLRRTGHVVWCTWCGRHAAARLGSGLLNRCRGNATGAYPTRIARLKKGLHPITGEGIT